MFYLITFIVYIVYLSHVGGICCLVTRTPVFVDVNQQTQPHRISNSDQSQ